VLLQRILECRQALFIARAEGQRRTLPALREQLAQQRLFGGLLLGAVELAGLQHEAFGAGPVLEQQQAANRPVGEAQAERLGLALPATPPQVADLCGQQPVRPLEARNHQAGLRIAAHAAPLVQVIAQADQQQEQAEAAAGVVEQQAQAALGQVGAHDHPARPVHRHGQPLLHRERRAGAQAQAVVALLQHGKGFALLTPAAGIGRHLGDLRAIRQLQEQRGTQDGELPVVAGDVPVQLVAFGMGDQLGIDPVIQLIGVAPRLQQLVRRAEVEALVGALALAVHAFRAAIAAGAELLDRGLPPQTARQAVAHRQVAVDAAADLLAGGIHGDALADLQHALCIQAQGHRKVFDALLFLGVQAGGQQTQAQAEQQAAPVTAHLRTPDGGTRPGWRRPG